MKEFKEKVAVVTGAASGIGRAMAERFSAEGMKLVLADINQEALAPIASDLKAKGISVLSVQTDVSKADSVEALAQKTLDTFGAIHLLCNNAGVAVSGPIWEHTLDDWQWVMSVNLWGVIHGVRVFTPLMLSQNTECHIVNTASTLGQISLPYLGIYNVTKHGVVALSETLYRELAHKEARVKVSVLCPAWVATQLGENSRSNRPAEFQGSASSEESPFPDYISAFYEIQTPQMRQELEVVLSPEQVAENVFQAVKDEKFYISTHPAWNNLVRNRMEDMLQGDNPDLFV